MDDFGSRFVGQIAAALILAIIPFSAVAETIVVAVEDKDWAPYYFWVDGIPTGPCPEIVSGTVRLMGDQVEFQRYPWVRVLKSVEEKKVDAGLCGTKTDERAAYSHYPQEPLLYYDATLFVRVDSPLTTSDFSELQGKSFGMIKGYTFAGVDDDLEAAGAIRIETNNRDNLLNLLTLGRIDSVLDSSLPLLADARRMDLAETIRPLLPTLDETPGYLFFSRKPGHSDLAIRFSEALRAFKKTPEYQGIQKRYGLRN
ncbi:MAG: transporter substrate-binding domain-containing protein [Limibacillus sp.]|jgi:polar amino acid transport system substrate-binding protein